MGSLGLCPAVKPWYSIQPGEVNKSEGNQHLTTFNKKVHPWVQPQTNLYSYAGISQGMVVASWWFDYAYLKQSHRQLWAPESESLPVKTGQPWASSAFRPNAKQIFHTRWFNWTCAKDVCEALRSFWSHWHLHPSALAPVSTTAEFPHLCGHSDFYI